MSSFVSIRNLFLALAVAVAVLVTGTPSTASTMPPVVHGMDPARSVWRNNYRDRFFVDIHKFSAISVLKGYSTHNHLLAEAIEARFNDEWETSVGILKELLYDLDSPGHDEVVYVTGLIYESLAFLPEAMGNYSRILGKEDGEYYSRTVLRISLVKFINGLKADSVFKMIDADGGFYRIYKGSDEEEEWKEALSGHALMLYVFGQHSNSESIFNELDKDETLNAAYKLARAENYMTLGLYINAMKVFDGLVELLKKEEEESLLAYVYLRIGDIAVLREEYVKAEDYYTKIPEGVEAADLGLVADSKLMKDLAMAELFIKQEFRDIEAIDILERLYGGTLPMGLGLDKTVALYLIDLYSEQGRTDEAFEVAKKFLIRHPKSAWEDELRERVETHLFATISADFEKKDYAGAVDIYYKNSSVIRSEETYLLVGNSFINLRLPSDAKKLFAALVKRDKGKGSTKARAGLAISHAMLGEGGEARKAIEGLTPIATSDKKALDAAYVALGDHYSRKGDFRSAAWAYGNASSVLSDTELKLSYSRALVREGGYNKAQGTLSSILESSGPGKIRAQALMLHGEVNFRLHRFSLARSSYMEAAQMLEGSEKAEAFYRLGETMLAAWDDKQRALSAWNKAVDVDAQSLYGKLSSERIKEVSAWQKSRM